VTGPLAAALTILVGAAAAVFSALVLLTVLRARLGGRRGRGLGCWVLLALLLAIWLVPGFLADGGSGSRPAPGHPAPGHPAPRHPAPAVSSL
jgi:hypothetical protein